MGIACDARGRGLGERVLRAALEEVRAASVIEIVYLMVRADSTPAIRLYGEAGFASLAVLKSDTRIGDAYFRRPSDEEAHAHRRRNSAGGTLTAGQPPALR